MSKHFNKTALALIAAGLAAACGHDEAKPVTREAVSAPTEIVQPAPLAATRTIAGTVRSANVSPLAAKVMGNVVRVHVAEGDRVKAGQLLVEIDARESVAQANAASSSIAAAEANAALAEATFRRFDALRARGSVSAQEFDNVKAQRDAAQAELARARAMSAQASAFLDYASVRAPMDGVVAQRFVDPGAQAAPGMPLLTIEDTRSYRIEALVPEDVIARAGDTVRIEIGGESIDAQITRVQPGVDPVTRSTLVQIAAGTAGSAGWPSPSARLTPETRLSASDDTTVSSRASEASRGTPSDRSEARAAAGDPSTPLRSGQYVRVSFTQGARDAIRVSDAALVRHGALTSVFVVGNDGVARMRLITLGENNEVLSGLSGGERIVSDASKVRDGVKVTS